MTTEPLPPVRLGTCQNDGPNQCAKTVAAALEMGYRHVDTARFYGNEAAVGDGIATADVPREAVFLASKLHPMVPRDDLVAHAQEHDYYLVAYSPLGRLEALELPAVETVAEKHGVSPADSLGDDPTVLVHGPYVDDEVIADARAKPVGLDELLERADMVTLHVRLSEATGVARSR